MKLEAILLRQIGQMWEDKSHMLLVHMGSRLVYVCMCVCYLHTGHESRKERKGC